MVRAVTRMAENCQSNAARKLQDENKVAPYASRDQLSLVHDVEGLALKRIIILPISIWRHVFGCWRQRNCGSVEHDEHGRKTLAWILDGTLGIWRNLHAMGLTTCMTSSPITPNDVALETDYLVTMSTSLLINDRASLSKKDEPRHTVPHYENGCVNVSLSQNSSFPAAISRTFYLEWETSPFLVLPAMMALNWIGLSVVYTQQHVCHYFWATRLPYFYDTHTTIVSLKDNDDEVIFVFGSSPQVFGLSYSKVQDRPTFLGVCEHQGQAKDFLLCSIVLRGVSRAAGLQGLPGLGCTLPWRKFRRRSLSFAHNALANIHALLLRRRSTDTGVFDGSMKLFRSIGPGHTREHTWHDDMTEYYWIEAKKHEALNSCFGNCLYIYSKFYG